MHIVRLEWSHLSQYLLVRSHPNDDLTSGACTVS